MHVLRGIAGTTLAFFVQSTGLAYAAPPVAEVQPVPYAPSQPVPAMPPPPPPPPAQGAALPLAHAQPGADVVYLKGGETMRGTLLELLPNDHATIQLASGEHARVPWNRIERIERQAVAAPRLVEPAPAGPAPRATALVHVEADEGVVLESLPPGHALWTVACTAPCDVVLPLESVYRISGPGIRRSRPFGLMARPGQHVVVTVAAASQGAFAAGVGLTSAGGAALLVGIAIVVVGASGTCTHENAFGFCDANAPNTGLEEGGGIVLLAGVAAIIVGAVLLAPNARSREVQTIASALAPSRHEDTAWLRTPAWRDARLDTPSPVAATTLPIFTQRF